MAVPGIPALVGTLVGALVAGGVAYVTARQNRLGNLELDRQKARRERHTARITPFLEAVDRRIYQYGMVVGTARAGDDAAFRAAVKDAANAEHFQRSSIMVLARRQGPLGTALSNFLTSEKAARGALDALTRSAVADGIDNVDGALIDGLAAAQGKLSVAIADLYDAIDDYLDGA